MAILYNDASFKCTWEVMKSSAYSEWKQAECYATSEEELHTSSQAELTVEVKENMPVKLHFDSDNFRFYMDGLSSLPVSDVEIDESGDTYLKSGVTVLFENSTQYYPFVPGHYQVEIKSLERSYFMWLHVRSKQVDEDQWNYMRIEIENEVTGLAQDLIKQNQSRSATEINGLPRTLIQKFQVIERHSKQLQAVLQQLSKSPHFQINKQYNWVNEHDTPVWDNQSVRSRQQQPDKKPFVKTPIKIINYDIHENQMLKKDLMYVDKLLTTLVKKIEDLKQSYISKEGTNIHPMRDQLIKERLEGFYLKAKRIKNLLYVIKELEWYQSVSTKQVTSMKGLSDFRYRLIHNIVKETKNQETNLSFKESFRVQWRRTDKLYEIWGYLKLAKILQNDIVGFQFIGGWLNEVDSTDELIPDLPRGALMKFQREHLTAHLTYDAQLPAVHSQDKKEAEPLRTDGTHHSPDARIDLYRNKIFIGSIIIDFKYRPQLNIWNNARLRSYHKTMTMEQLLSYQNEVKSSYLYEGSIQSFLIKNINAVQEVWAIFPEREPSGINKIVYDRIRMIELSPMSENLHVIDQIKQSIDEIERGSELFLR
ncbi:DUF2357 domain-containing protein [Alkalicoccobacillus gibsonii]|uniref:DUF2357 domain-containing protein n=1 Tax=Alkalicoccobacillus gibsonii TaxID=79881 RepID=A0ABU9VLZ8_9BACI